MPRAAELRPRAGRRAGRRRCLAWLGQLLRVDVADLRVELRRAGDDAVEVWREQHAGLAGEALALKDRVGGAGVCLRVTRVRAKCDGERGEGVPTDRP